MRKGTNFLLQRQKTRYNVKHCGFRLHHTSFKTNFASVKKAIILAAIILTAIAARAQDDSRTDSLTRLLDEVSVSAIKRQTPEVQPVASTVLRRGEVERLGILTMKQVSEISPKFYIPDYGSRMTSSIYVRGLGARIDQPVVGLNVDNVPILNKDNYDFDVLDIDRIEVLRGPQCTLYGRNNMGGVVNISTLSPLRYKGLRLFAELGTGLTARLGLSYYFPVTKRVGMSLSAQGQYQKGWERNSFTSGPADREEGGAARWKTVWQASPTFTLTNTASVSFSRQHGYPYAYEKTGEIAYNDTCYYRRLTVMDGLTAVWHVGGVQLASISSVQYIDDNMTLDQDFLPLSYFTMQQIRREWAVTQDFVAKGSAGKHYRWLAGAFGFYKRARMSAPVTFKETGIAELIEARVNSMNPLYPVKWDSDRLPLYSDFVMPDWGIAFYHRSTFEWDAWTAEVDLRLDRESVSLDYASACNSNYTVYNLTDPAHPSVYAHRTIDIDNHGYLSKSFLQFLPKITLTRRFGSAGSLIYLSVAKGYKPGGYNTQMFSDVLQQELMEKLGVTKKYDVNQIIGYDPEKSWNYEIGGSYVLPSRKLTLSATAFYIDCRDQQLTMFPDGTTTGRIMTNAGKTRSMGVELSGRIGFLENYSFTASYGFTDARFVSFDNGREKFDGKRIPYAPAHTLFAALNGDWRLGTSGLRLNANINLRGVGSIFWDEANTRRQPFYALLGASVALEAQKWTLTLWGENLTQTHYNTFNYVSIGNTFYQRGKPARAGITFRLFI